MEPFHSLDIAKETITNKNYRKVIYTGKHMQLVLMALNKGEDIPEEIHEHIDQFFRVESGSGKAIINGREYKLKDNSALIIPSGSKHYIKNTGNKPLKLYTIYTPPQHPEDRVDERQPREQHGGLRIKINY